MNTVYRALFPALACTLSACESAPKFAFDVVKSSMNCPYSESMFMQLNSQEDIRRSVQSTSQILLQKEQSEKPQNKADFDQFYFFIVAAGKRGTAGYQFEVENKSASFDKKSGAVELPLTLLEPAADAMQAQMLTSPCVVVRLQKGEFSSVKYAEQMISLK